MQTTLAQFNETQSTDAFALQNSKLLKVSLNQVTVQAKLGSMVAYQGDVTFEHAGSGGMGRMLKKAVSGEGTSLMKMTGIGRGVPGRQAQDIHLIYLENDTITVNGPNLLAFDAGIDWDIHRLRAAPRARWPAACSTWSCTGTGWVAILSDGPPVLLNVAQAPTFADAQAAITWSSGVPSAQDRLQDEEPDRPRLRRVDPARVQGQGWALVQPSEGRIVAPAGGRPAAGWGTCSTANPQTARAAFGSVQTWMTSSSASGSSTVCSHAGHHQRASSAVPHTACRSGSPPPALRAPQSASSRSAPPSSRPESLSS